MTGPLTEEEVAQTVALMKRIEFKPHCPEPVFFAWEQAFYSNAVELAVIRQGQQGNEILLAQRPASDPYFAGQWHMPGQVILPGRKIRDSLAELMIREIGMISGPPQFIHLFEFSREERERGQGFCFLHLVRMESVLSATIKEGRFFPLYDLPDRTIAHHVTMITEIRKHLLTC